MISVSVIDINTVIANYNYSAYKAGKIDIDVEQIGSLGASGLPVLVKLSEEKALDENYDVICEIENNSYEIYNNGFYSIYDIEEIDLKQTNIFQKNYVLKQGKIALSKFVENNPDFDYDKFYEEYEKDGWY